MSAAIERLRAEREQAATVKRYTVDEIVTLRDMLKAVHPVGEIAEATGLTPDQVVDLTAEFGTWLTHVNGGANVDVELAANTGRLWPSNDIDGVVVVPLGFERSAWHKRDVSKSLAAIVVHDPDENTVRRWVDRRYPADTAVLKYLHVTTVWFFTKLGREGELDEIGPDPVKNAVFRKPLVDAYDLLKVAVDDAQDGIRTIGRLCQAAPDDLAAELPALRDAATKLEWVQPGDTKRLIALVDAAMENPTALRSVKARLGTIARTVRANPKEWIIRGIGDLNLGQVQQIARAAGLSIEGVSSKEESEIRQRLDELGLRADIDQLLADGVDALEAGVIDTYWAAMELRAAGDPSWREVLESAHADAA